ARSRGENDDPAFLEMSDRTAADVRLRDLANLDRGLHARRHAGLLERVLEREAVHDRREHPHVIALRSVHPLAGAFEPSENVAAADDDPDLDAMGVNLAELDRGLTQDVRLDAVPGRAGERIAAQLQENSLVFQTRGRRWRGDRDVTFFPG